jgi:hypothetical protein
LLHTYHAKAKTIVPVRRNDTTNEVAQGRDTSNTPYYGSPSLHTYHAKAKTIVPVRRNDATNEVAQGRDTSNTPYYGSPIFSLIIFISALIMPQIIGLIKF